MSESLTNIAWVAGWNNPGYLPEMEPEEFETQEEAVRFLIEEAKCREDMAAEDENEERAEAWCHFAEDLNAQISAAGNELSETAPDGQAFWVHVAR